MSRRVLPVCGNLCFFCPSLRARSRQPVKRYKKLLAEIFPRSQVILLPALFVFIDSSCVMFPFGHGRMIDPWILTISAFLSSSSSCFYFIFSFTLDRQYLTLQNCSISCMVYRLIDMNFLIIARVHGSVNFMFIQSLYSGT